MVHSLLIDARLNTGEHAKKVSRSGEWEWGSIVELSKLVRAKPSSNRLTFEYLFKDGSPLSRYSSHIYSQVITDNMDDLNIVKMENCKHRLGNLSNLPSKTPLFPSDNTTVVSSVPHADLSA